MNIPDFVRNELIHFTGLSPNIIDLYLSRKGYPNFQEEWKFWKPDSDENIRWFYICSRGYLFANAIHILPNNILLDIPKGSKILDFGGGSGNFSFALCKHSCSVSYFEINTLQKEFVKFVSKKHSMDLKVLEHDSLFLPIISEKMDAIIALDVLEHIPNYQDYIYKFSECIKPGGSLYIFAPFGEGGDVTHLSDKAGINNVLSNAGFVLDKYISINTGVDCSKYKSEK